MSENPKALFIGNGINRVSQNAISWGELLDRLSKKFEIDVDLTNDLKPFPLAFEEMIHSRLGDTSFEDKLRNLKSTISNLFLHASDDFDFRFHKEIMNSGVNEIITTNYDYNLELSVDSGFLQKKRELSLNRQESKHSLYRGYDIKGVRVRHIHGELSHNRRISNTGINYPEESIMIGFQHYSEYLHRIQSLILGGPNKRKYIEGILERKTDGKETKVWADLFFTHDIVFIGFTLDFSEAHLWWLLMQREEILRKHSFFGLPENTITFLFPDMPFTADEYENMDEERFNKLYRKKLTLQRNKAITDILRSFKINIIPVECQSYTEFYQCAVKMVKNRQL